MTSSFRKLSNLAHFRFCLAFHKYDYSIQRVALIGEPSLCRLIIIRGVLHVASRSTRRGIIIYTQYIDIRHTVQHEPIEPNYEHAMRSP